MIDMQLNGTWRIFILAVACYIFLRIVLKRNNPTIKNYYFELRDLHKVTGYWNSFKIRHLPRLFFPIRYNFQCNSFRNVLYVPKKNGFVLLGVFLHEKFLLQLFIIPRYLGRSYVFMRLISRSKLGCQLPILFYG